MTTYQTYVDFTAQGRNVSALMSLYALIERSDGQRIELTPFVVFIAFAIESYLNTLGSKEILFWDSLERLPWRSKIVILHAQAKAVPDWGSEPLQFASEVFKLRDKLAHGKSEQIRGPLTRDWLEAHRPHVHERLQPEWYKSITLEWVLRAKERFVRLMQYLGNLFGEHESHHALLATGGVITDDETDT